MSDIGWTLNLSDPVLMGAAIGIMLIVLLFALLIWAIRAARRSASAAEPLGSHMGALTEAVRHLDQGQHQLAGGLKMVSEHQASARPSIR